MEAQKPVIKAGTDLGIDVKVVKILNEGVLVRSEVGTEAKWDRQAIEDVLAMS
jgi:hypothetical protein